MPKPALGQARTLDGTTSMSAPDPTRTNQPEMRYWKIIAAHETVLQGMLAPAEQG
jgi:hypothetical protein